MKTENKQQIKVNYKQLKNKSDENKIYNQFKRKQGYFHSS